MSNVTVGEIVKLCATNFGVATAELRRADGDVWTPALKAKAAAIYLARRHTLHSYAAICDRIGYRGGFSAARMHITRLEAEFENLAARDREVPLKVALIEDGIDEIHERRWRSISPKQPRQEAASP